MNNIALEKGADGIVVAMVDMPGRAFNVFSDDMIDDLEALIATLESDPDITGVVITSGKASFMAGADLAMVRGFTTMRFTHEPAAIRATVSRLSYLLRRLEKVRVPTVAAINGLALGGGLELALACHHRVAIASDVPCLGVPEILLGLLPGAGGTQRLPRLVGLPLAARMLLDGKPVAPTAALAAGLVDRLAATDELIDAAQALARTAAAGARWDAPQWQAPADETGMLRGEDAGSRIAENASIAPRVHHLYPAIGAVCRCLIDGYAQAIDAAIEVEINNFTPLMLDPVAGNMVRTLFLSKTGAAKRASAVVGDKVAVASIAVAGERELPPRLLRRFAQAADFAAADAVVLLDGHADDAGDNVVAFRDVLRDPPTPCAVEIRTPGRPGEVDVVEIAAEPGSGAARALAVVERMGLVPIVTRRAEPGLYSRLIAVVRDWADESATSATERAAIADAVDAHALFSRCGLSAGDAAEYTAGDRAAGLDLMARLAVAAANCLACGVAQTAEDIDVAAVVGLGFPAWSGGPLTFADAVRRGELTPPPPLPGIGEALFYSR